MNSVWAAATLLSFVLTVQSPEGAEPAIRKGTSAEAKPPPVVDGKEAPGARVETGSLDELLDMASKKAEPGLRTGAEVKANNPLAAVAKGTRVARVEIGSLEGDPFDKPTFKATCITVTDAAGIGKLVNALAPLENQDLGMPFSGVLSYQVFLDANGQVICAAEIINTPGALVMMQRSLPGQETDAENRVRPFSTSAPSYCRLVLDLMEKSCPAVLEELNKFDREVYGKRARDIILSGVAEEK